MRRSLPSGRRRRVGWDRCIRRSVPRQVWSVLGRQLVRSGLVDEEECDFRFRFEFGRYLGSLSMLFLLVVVRNSQENAAELMPMQGSKPTLSHEDWACISHLQSNPPRLRIIDNQSASLPVCLGIHRAAKCHPFPIVPGSRPVHAKCLRRACQIALLYRPLAHFRWIPARDVGASTTVLDVENSRPHSYLLRHVISLGCLFGNKMGPNVAHLHSQHRI